jgi:hypothetical protein
MAATMPVLALCAQNTRTDSGRQPPVSGRGRLPVAGCAGQPISNIVIITQPPYTDRLPKRFDFLRRAARSLHVTTRDDVIRRYLLLHPGDPCNQIRRAESERILRAQPFLVDARIRVYDDEHGGVVLEVETRDEFSLLVAPRLTSRAPVFRGLRLGDGNIGGTARFGVLQWREGLSYRDLFGMQFTDYQFAGGRNELRLLGVQREQGQELRAQLVRPYYTDLQRFAFIGSAEGTRAYAGFLRNGLPTNAVNSARESELLGGVARIGSVRELKLAGLTISRSIASVDSLPVIIGRNGFQPDSGPGLGVSFRRQQVIRVNGLLGLRALQFVPVQGFDALSGTQDVRVGYQIGVAYGQSIAIGAARDHDRFLSTGLYGGIGGPKTFVGLQLISEARNDRGARVWDNHITSGRLGWYFRPAVRQLSTVSLEWSAGRDMRTPFQLSFADLDGGMHGYRNTQTPGAERLVVRAEQRLVLPSRLNVADVGLAGFAEAGKLWADRSVPYSQTTPVRGAVGVSILAAVPPQSRRLWRVDFAMPLGSDPRKKFEVRFSNEDRTRVFWRDPRDVAGARERTVPTSLFTWP